MILDVKAQAEKELAEECWRKAVDAEKERIKKRRSQSFLVKLFPWKLLIVRRDQ